MIQLPEFWLGDYSSFSRAVRAYAYQLEHPEVKLQVESGEDEDDEDKLMDYLVDSITQYRGRIGIINVEGPLMNGESIFTLWFGGVSYNMISAALQRMLDDDGVSKIVMNYTTNGGDAAGIESASANLKTASGIKPVYSYVNGGALSAGYWLASQGRVIAGSRMSEVGSIGVVTTFTSYARALEQEGIDVTVIRGGKYKAMAHPAERLSREAEEYIENRTNRLYEFFYEHVADNRPVKVEDKEQWAEGKVFFFEEGIKAGLADVTMEYGAFLRQLQTHNPESDEDLKMPKKIILNTPEDVAAAAAGVPLDQLEHTEEDVEEIVATDVAGTEDGTEEALEEPSEETSEPAPQTPNADLVAFLREELSGTRKELATAQATIAKLESRLESSQEAETALREPAISAVDRMCTALGMQPIPMDKLPATTIAEQYRSVKAKFDDRFSFAGTRQSLDGENVKGGDDEYSKARRAGLYPVK